MKKIFLFAAMSAMILSMVSCSSDSSSIPDDQQVRFFVVNEGNYGTGNGSLSSVMKDNSTMKNLFALRNNRPLGDVPQSMTIFDGTIYMSVTNSSKIELFDADDYTSIKTLTATVGDIYPRFMHPFMSKGQARIAVSDYSYINPQTRITIINPQTKSICDYVEIGTTSAQIANTEGKLFVAGNANNTSGAAIYVIDADELKVIDTIDIAVATDTRIMKDHNGKLWVLSGGFDDQWNTTLYALVCIDPRNNAITKRIDLNMVQTSYDGCYSTINKAGNKIYFNSNKSVYEVDIDNATSAPTTPLFSYSTFATSIYNLTATPEGTLLICDPKNYTIEGSIYEVSTSGALLNTFNAGISPGFIYFK